MAKKVKHPKGNGLNGKEPQGSSSRITGQGNHIGGDMVSGDKISFGDISGSSTVLVGKGNQAVVQKGLDDQQIARLFQQVYALIDARTPDPKADKDEITQTVQRVEREIHKGQQAEPGKIQRWMDTLAKIAPDIFAILAAALTNPSLGVAEAVRRAVQVLFNQRSF